MGSQAPSSPLRCASSSSSGRSPTLRRYRKVVLLRESRRTFDLTTPTRHSTSGLFMSPRAARRVGRLAIERYSRTGCAFLPRIRRRNEGASSRRPDVRAEQVGDLIRDRPQCSGPISSSVRQEEIYSRDERRAIQSIVPAVREFAQMATIRHSKSSPSIIALKRHCVRLVYRRVIMRLRRNSRWYDHAR